MTIKQWILSGLTVLVTLLVGLSLADSLAKPQLQSQLELYQTNLVLEASQWQGNAEEQESGLALGPLIGDNPLQSALEQYQNVRSSAQEILEGLGAAPPAAPTEPELNPRLGSTPIRRSPQQQLQQLLTELNLRIGILQAKLGQVEQAQATWAELARQPQLKTLSAQQVATAQVLSGLWSNPPRLLPDAEGQIQQSLTGWFRHQALEQLYQLQQRQDALAALQIQEQAAARDALLRLTLVGVMPALGSLMGIVLVLGWLVRQALTKSGESAPPAWSVPWGSDTIWQVMVLWFTGFFAVSLVGVPLVVQLLGLNPVTFGPRTQAFFALFSYGALMATGLTILYLCLKPFVPQPVRWLPIAWQRSRWLWWGIGGYLAALPLVILVSLINQRLLEQRGGGNPLLEIILRSEDRLTISVLFVMVAVLAPVFEETLFRGFFLTSLTRYLPTWGAIVVSGGLFAVAHLNLSDILPLTVLGIVLGFVYTRSRNLLSSILLHGIWNSGSLLGLLVLSGGAN